MALCNCDEPDVYMTEGRYNCGGAYLVPCHKCGNILKLGTENYSNIFLKGKSKMKKAKKTKKSAVKTKSNRRRSELKIVNLKTNGKDRETLTKNAKRFAKGNLSAWLRHAGLKYIPKKGEKIAEEYK